MRKYYVDRNIFYAVIHDTTDTSEFLGVCISQSTVVSNREESVLVYINFMYFDTSMTRCGNQGIVTLQSR